VCGKGKAALTISGMGNVSVPIAPVSVRACVTGGLGLRRDTLRLLPCDRSKASWFPEKKSLPTCLKKTRFKTTTDRSQFSFDQPEAKKNNGIGLVDRDPNPFFDKGGRLMPTNDAKPNKCSREQRTKICHNKGAKMAINKGTQTRRKQVTLNMAHTT